MKYSRENESNERILLALYSAYITLPFYRVFCIFFLWPQEWLILNGISSTLSLKFELTLRKNEWNKSKLIVSYQCSTGKTKFNDYRRIIAKWILKERRNQASWQLRWRDGAIFEWLQITLEINELAIEMWTINY